jgi:hypothetical protein
MDAKDIELLITKLQEIENRFGIRIAIIIAVFTITIIVTWIFIVKRIAKVAEEASEKSLQKFQSQLDKDLFKFQTKHQKQIDAIHETFQKFQRLTSLINFVLKGEKFIQLLNSKENVVSLIKFRNEFKDIYQINRLLFQKSICEKIDHLIPVVDKFIKTYEGGIMPEPTAEEIELNGPDGMYIEGYGQQTLLMGS